MIQISQEEMTLKKYQRIWNIQQLGEIDHCRRIYADGDNKLEVTKGWFGYALY